MKSNRKATLWKKQLLPLVAALVLSGVRTVSASDYPTTILADNPMAYYRLEETSGTTAIDSSSTGAFPATYAQDNTAIYPIQGQPGIDTNSISLNAQFPSSVVAYDPAFDAQAPFSFELWVRPTSTSASDYRCPIGNFSGWNVATPSGWYVYQTPGSPTTFAFITASGVWITYSGVNVFNWYHLVGTYDGTNASFYVNGTLVGTQSALGYNSNSLENEGVNFFGIGQRGDNTSYFDGNIDEVAYYANALTAAQVLAHYQVGTNSFRVVTNAPSILVNPVSTNAYAGLAAKFSVLADGTAPLSYQWFKGTSAIDGATTATLTFTCSPEDDGTSYYVVVTNFNGSITSSVVTLSVSTGLAVDAPPTSITRNAGSAAAFEVVAEGAVPVSYQWYKGLDDSTPIDGATNQILWLSDVQLADDASTYHAAIINPYTSIDSGSATLNVQTRAVNVPLDGYGHVVMADAPVAYWRLDEPDGSTTAVDAAGSFDGTYVAGDGLFTFDATTGIPHETNAAVEVNGGATVSIPYAIEINPGGAFTYEGWFQPASTPTDGNDYRTAMSSMSNPYGVGPTGWLLYQTGGDNWAWWPYGGFWVGAQLTDTDPIVAGQWYHIVLTYDGTTFTLYVNGVAKASAPYSGFVQNGNVPDGGASSYNYNYNTTPGLPTGSGPVTLGWRNPVDFNPFDGVMDDVAIYNKALTPEQVENHYLNTTHISAVMSGSNIVITWATGTLQSSDTINGPYTDVDGASAPSYTVPANQPQQFYRIKLQ